jgi:5-methylcytosine-specific restriction endonuclease McrA
MSLDTYQLPGQASDVPQDVRDLYRASGFAREVRDWHLARIPRYTIPAGTYIVCPYCGKQKDRRSVQIDHIIPARVYVRYSLYLNRATLDDRTVVGHAKAAYNDRKNVLLACMRCNSGKSDRVLTRQEYVDAIGHAGDTALADRLRASWQTLQSIRALPRGNGGGGGIGPIRRTKRRMDDAEVDVNAFVASGPTWSTRSSFHPTRLGDDLQAELSAIHNAVVTILEGGSRPAWTVAITDLEDSQPSADYTNEEGRLCLYCMGLFKKQAFQLDHINPASRRSESTYNDPTNLLPVCRTCNTGKGNAYLTTSWLNEQIERRMTEGLPGLELVASIPGATAQEKLAWAVQHRVRIVGK